MVDDLIKVLIWHLREGIEIKQQTEKKLSE
jgi:hypothetical protein